MRNEFEPTSELCRVMPPRRLRQSQLREALNASYGIDDPDDSPAAAEPRSRRRRRPRIRTASLRTLGWLKAVATATVPVVLGGLIVAYLLTRH